MDWCVHSSAGIIPWRRCTVVFVSKHNSISGGCITVVHSQSRRPYVLEVHEIKGEKMMDVIKIHRRSF